MFCRSSCVNVIVALWVHDEKRKETERVYTESSCPAVFCESGSHTVMAHYNYSTTHTHTHTHQHTLSADKTAWLV